MIAIYKGVFHSTHWRWLWFDLVIQSALITRGGQVRHRWGKSEEIWIEGSYSMYDVNIKYNENLYWHFLNILKWHSKYLSNIRYLPKTGNEYQLTESMKSDKTYLLVVVGTNLIHISPFLYWKTAADHFIKKINVQSQSSGYEE